MNYSRFLPAYHKAFFFMLLLFAVSGPLYAQNSIVETSAPKGWLIQTKFSVYQIVVTPSGVVKPVFYGPSEQAGFLKKNASWQEGIEEVPVRGGHPIKTPQLEVIFSDKVRDAELEFVRAEQMTIENRPVLKLVQKDKHYPLEVTSYIRVLAEFDILEKWVSIKNTGKKGNILVENLQSGSMVLPTDEYTLTQLAGYYNSEAQLIEGDLTPGIKVIESKAFRSNGQVPWFLVKAKGTGAEQGPAWFGSLHYSGNWKLAFDKAFNGHLQVVGGVNFWDTSITLQPGRSFESPKLTIGFTTEGEEGAQRSLTGYVRKTILPEAHRNDLRPILYNSWYTSHENLDEEGQYQLAKTAAELGAELFVIDAGWYKLPNKTWSEVGDWTVDPKKFPNGFTSLIKRVNDLGLKFGFWVEPENIHVASDTYKKHPEWALHYPTRTGVPRKSLNLAREDVYQHLLKTLSDLLTNNKIDFIKWDQNLTLRDTGWPDAPDDVQRSVRIKMTENLYRLVDELKKRFPQVWFENCSTGGGRADLGMLSRMDQMWPSDNSSALDRLRIQYGFLSALPANSLVSWVSDHGMPQSLNYKFDMAMCGVLGIGENISKWSDAQKATGKAKIELYKRIRPLVQQGNLYRLASPFKTNRSALQYNNEQQTSSVLICHNMVKYLDGAGAMVESKTLKLQGLNPDKTYMLKKPEEKDDKAVTYTGSFLMNIGIPWPVARPFESQVLLINQLP